MSEHYNIILFTSATEDYAQEIKELIDPKGFFVQQAVSRSHCVFSKKQVRSADRDHHEGLEGLPQPGPQ